jgi:hypothetical protein
MGKVANQHHEADDPEKAKRKALKNGVKCGADPVR